MDNIKKFKLKYFNECVNILDEQWDMGKRASESKGNICAKIYLLEILIYSTKIIVYTENGRVIGYAGYYKRDDKRNNIKRKIYVLIQKILLHSPKIKHKDKIREYYKVYNYTPDNLNNYFDGDLSILILEENYIGKGIGTILFNKICKMAKEDGIRKMSIDTDDACNWGFYEAKGCKRIYETVICGGENRTEKAYIYEKIL